jgi:hypothetical protein
MYCNNCGKPNPEGSNFCKSCGSQIVKVSKSGKTESINEAKADQPNINNRSEPQKKEVKAGLTGWLALVGLGLIVNPLIQGYSLLGSIPLLTETFDIPGYTNIIWIEFIVSITLVFLGIYLLIQYLKKKTIFPKHYVIFLIFSAIYVVFDHALMSSLVAPTIEQQNIISNALSQNLNTVTRTVVFAIIWSLYMTKSKQVKATFINN